MHYYDFLIGAARAQVAKNFSVYITDVERPKQARGERSRDVNTTVLHEIARSTTLEGSRLILEKYKPPEGVRMLKEKF